MSAGLTARSQEAARKQLARYEQQATTMLSNAVAGCLLSSADMAAACWLLLGGWGGSNAVFVRLRAQPGTHKEIEEEDASGGGAGAERRRSGSRRRRHCSHVSCRWRRRRLYLGSKPRCCRRSCTSVVKTQLQAVEVQVQAVETRARRRNSSWSG
jgi:hypothetical protein